MGTIPIEEHQADFTEDEYRHLLKLARANYEFVSYDQSATTERAVIWRHDVDLSVHRATKLAAIEAAEGIAAHYFIHLHSEFYHWGEKAITGKIWEIKNLGHRLGLHFDPGYYNGRIQAEADLVEELLRERAMLESEFGEIAMVSFHNPDAGGDWLKFNADLLAGMHNAYGVTVSNNFAYCSDSNGYWRFDRLKEVLQAAEAPRLHVLTHPGWWQEQVISPMARVDRCIQGRAEATRARYICSLNEMGRKNIGLD